MSGVRLAMHYSVPLALDEIGEIRERVRAAGPVFDALPGLVTKLFLLGPAPAYSLYYLWESPGAMLTFLEGELFARLVARFGRPRVYTYLTRAKDFPFTAASRLSVQLEQDRGTVLHDPLSGAGIALVAEAAGDHEVLYRAGPK
jgi:hypothetical protein